MAQQTIREMEQQYRQLDDNVSRLRQQLPNLNTDAQQRAERSIDNLRQQMLKLDKIMLRAQCAKDLK